MKYKIEIDGVEYDSLFTKDEVIDLLMNTDEFNSVTIEESD